MHITVTARVVNGEEKMFPACSKSEAFAALAGTKTITEKTLRQISAAGYEIVVQRISMRRSAPLNVDSPYCGVPSTVLARVTELRKQRYGY